MHHPLAYDHFAVHRNSLHGKNNIHRLKPSQTLLWLASITANLSSALCYVKHYTCPLAQPNVYVDETCPLVHQCLTGHAHRTDAAQMWPLTGGLQTAHGIPTDLHLKVPRLVLPSLHCHWFQEGLPQGESFVVVSHFRLDREFSCQL